MNNKKNTALLSLKKKGASLERNYLEEYLNVAPTSLALVRAIECRLLSRIEFKHPLLDIGCGDGLFASLFFEEEIEDGIDISPVEIKSAKMRGIYRNLKIANVLNLPYEDGTFETIFSNCVLEHIQDIDNALIETSRVLKNDGTLIFTVPSDTYGENLFISHLFKQIGMNWIGKLYAQKLNSLCRHLNLHNPTIWEQKLEKAGLKMVSCTRYLSPGATKIHDIMLIFSVPSIINKKLFRRMILFPALRRWIVVPILSPVLRGYYESDSEKGSSLLIVARKQGEK